VPGFLYQIERARRIRQSHVANLGGARRHQCLARPLPVPVL